MDEITWVKPACSGSRRILAVRTDDATELLEQVLFDRERILGPEHPDTDKARESLDAMRRDAGGEESN